MNQSGNRNSIFGWVKNLKRNTLSNESLDEINDDVSAAESRSPSRTSFQSGPFPGSPTKEKSIPQLQAPYSNTGASGSGHGNTPEFLRPLLSHKSRSTNNVNNSISRSLSNQDSGSVGLRQQRDSFLQNNALVDENSKYFGVPLADAVNQAAAKISFLGSESSNAADDDVLHYGRIPLVVAKCGVYLKKNGLNVEGIFRVGGSSKRIKELQIVFNSAPEFGKKLNWDGFTVHDAASVFRRYLNALPEPLIPLDLYEEFRDPLRSRPRIRKYLKYKADNSTQVLRKPTIALNVAASSSAQPSAPTSPRLEPSSSSPSSEQNNTKTADTSVSESNNAPHQNDNPEKVSNPEAKPARLKSAKKARGYKSLSRDVYGAIDEYKHLVDELPSLSKQLLFYILDLLAMVQSFSSENLMSSRNLAAIFQPSILSHPSHDMDPEEYALSQSVVEFLIQYSYKLLPNNETKAENLSSPPVDSPPQSSNQLPVRIPTRRQHSKSLSTPNHDLDFIGFRSTTRPTRSFSLSDTDHDFVSASSDDEDELEKQMHENWNLLTSPQLGQKETTSSNPDDQLSEPTALEDVPVVVLDDTK
ncbi:hypothetical protein JCM33374_g102 [Metschnikowia sp. JCM 33374]|nr:hypothetical protein JCM33374_g102 [Metschnikowia sp. JCM 33374]